MPNLRCSELIFQHLDVVLQEHPPEDVPYFESEASKKAVCFGKWALVLTDAVPAWSRGGVKEH